jgi:hypothetical protein
MIFMAKACFFFISSFFLYNSDTITVLFISVTRYGHSQPHLHMLLLFSLLSLLCLSVGRFIFELRIKYWDRLHALIIQ